MADRAFPRSSAGPLGSSRTEKSQLDTLLARPMTVPVIARAAMMTNERKIVLSRAAMEFLWKDLSLLERKCLYELDLGVDASLVVPRGASRARHCTTTAPKVEIALRLKDSSA